MGSPPRVASLLAAGDCGPVHGPSDGYPVERYSEQIAPLLSTFDVRIANCERQYSDRGTFNVDNPHGCQPPHMAEIFRHCGFDMLSLANNHMYDFGPDALLDTRELLEGFGIAVAGAGADLDEARRPAILDIGSAKIGLISYSSIIPEGGSAGPDKPGIATLRTTAMYEPRGPHLPPRVHSVADQDDLGMLLADVKALRDQVDVVLVSIHWGVIWAPRIVADYQVEVAHACIDAGADMILGHHAHLPKAIEMYKGKAIFYSLSNFCMTKPFPAKNWAEEPWKHGALRNHADQDDQMPLLPYGADAKRSLVATARIEDGRISEVGYIPLAINDRYQPEQLVPGDGRFEDAVRYMEWATEGFDTTMTVRDGTVYLGEA